MKLDRGAPRLRRWLLLLSAVACGRPSEGPLEAQSAPKRPSAMASTPAPDSRLPLEALAEIPAPGMAAPTAIRFSPVGGDITYLHSPEGTLTRQLFVFDPGTGQVSTAFSPLDGGDTEANLSPAEKLRRERQRIRGLGVTGYAWAETVDRFLVPSRGDVWVQDGVQGEPRKVVDGHRQPALDARFSRDGEWIAYVMDDELYVVSHRGGDSVQVTEGARGCGKTHGLAEFIAQEEMQRHHGFWWSDDAERLAFTEVDERGVTPLRIDHAARDERSHEEHAYPFAGKANAQVRLGVVNRRGGRVVWMDLAGAATDPTDFYLARVHWMPSGDLIVELENREQSRLDLWRFDPDTGKGRRVLTEQSSSWINLHSLFEPLREGRGELQGAFLWASEQSGYRHLALVSASGRTLRALTEGPWMVDEVASVDEARGLVYFLATKDDPRERHLYRVPLAGGEVERLTKRPGFHSVSMDRRGEWFVDGFSSIETPPRAIVVSTGSGEIRAELPIAVDPRVARFGLEPPELTTLELPGGPRLYGAVYAPAGPGPFPTVVSVYGGPHAQRVVNAWRLTADLRAQFLRKQGYLVFKLDNRGSARRGLEFEAAIRHDLGNVEIQDQRAGVQWLVERGLTDPERVAIYGWSYGGYLAAMGLARAPETFRTAVAGAPVTSWDGYDTHYTERYMGTPQINPRGYEASSVMTHVEKIRGALLLVHGLIDENVHFRHTARLIHALIRAGKPHRLVLFPDERHMPRSEADRVYMERQIWDFLKETL